MSVEDCVAKTVIELPTELEDAVAKRVAEGEFADPGELVVEAVRYYLDRHRDEDWREYVSKEVAWSTRHGHG